MLYHYCTLSYFKNTEVCHSEVRKDGTVLVHFETPDAKYGFKTLDCVLPKYTVEECTGYTDEEVFELKQFCVNNAASFIEFARIGGIANA